MPALIAPLFRLSFWFSFETVPFTLWVSYLIGAVLVLLLIAAGIVSFYRQSLKDKLLKRFWGNAAACLVSASIIGLLLYFMTWEAVPILGMRAFWPVWFVTHILWGVGIYLSARKILPIARAAEADRQAYEKWLPKAKK